MSASNPQSWSSACEMIHVNILKPFLHCTPKATLQSTMTSPPPSSCPRCGPALRHRDKTCNCRHHHSTEPPTCTSSCSGYSRCRCHYPPPLRSCSYWHQLILYFKSKCILWTRTTYDELM